MHQKNKLPQRFKPRKLTYQEYNEYQKFVERRCLSTLEIEYVCNLFESVFNKTKTKKTTKSLIGMIDKLDKVYENYNKNTK